MKAYVCIGGPLNGQFATSNDFRPERKSYDYKTAHPFVKNQPLIVHLPAGRYNNYRHEYYRYNSGGRNGVSMVWIHSSLLKAPVNAR